MVEFVAPLTFVPFLNHWKVGEVPPLTGVAVKVTLVPEHTVVAGTAVILTLAGSFGLTVIVRILDVAGDPVMQEVALEVIMQEI